MQSSQRVFKQNYKQKFLFFTEWNIDFLKIIPKSDYLITWQSTLGYFALKLSTYILILVSSSSSWMQNKISNFG